MSVEDTRTFWDQQAPTFDEEPDHGLTDPVTRLAWATLLDGFLEKQEGRDSVVDLGCGTGSVSVLLAERGHSVVGVDLSPKMIERAQHKARTNELDLEFMVGDVQNMGIPRQTYGAVVSRHLLWAMPDPPALVKRWSAPLTDSGLFIAIEGVWATAGTDPESVMSALEPHFEHMEYTDLSDERDLWGKDVTDHRYAVVGSQPKRS